MVLLTKVYVVVHAIDPDRFPTTPAGWRWAVMVGDHSPSDLRWCANAAWAPNRQEAELEGEHAGVAACKAVRMFGVPCEWGGVLVLDTDPVPPHGDRISMLG